MSNLKDFQPPGYVAWQAVQTSSFTASAGRGYPINTTGGGVTVTLPAAASRGDTIEFSDYGAKFGTNNVILNLKGTNLCLSLCTHLLKICHKPPKN